MKKNYLFKLLLSVALLIGGCGCVMAQDRMIGMNR